MNRQTHQWNIIESPEISPSRYANLIYYKCGFSNHVDKSGLFNNQYFDHWVATGKNTKLELYFTPFARLDSKWIRELNVKTEAGIRRKHGWILF